MLINIARESFIATDKWYFEYVSCFSNADKSLNTLPSTTLMNTTRNDVKIEITLIATSCPELASPLSPRESFRILKPKFIPKATHSNKKVIEYVMKTFLTLLIVDIDKFSQ